MAYDNERTNILKEFDLEVIRFSNYDVNTNFEGVCVEIDRVVKRRISQMDK